MTSGKLLIENEELRARLRESEEALNAIRNGEVDAIVVSGKEGEKVFSLTSAETPYRIILEEMDEGAVITQSNGTILYFNKRFEAIFSESPKRIAGANILDFISGNQRPKLKNLLKKTLKGRAAGIIRYTSSSFANPIYLNFSVRSLSPAVGGNICIIISDITKIKDYQDHLHDLVKERTLEIEKANKQLEKLNSDKDQFLTILGHDLKNPFSSVIGLSELLVENLGKCDMAEIENIANHINSSAQNAFNLLVDLLMWARAESGKIHFEPQKLNLLMICTDVLKTLYPNAIAKNITINLSTSDDIDIFADVDMLKTVLRNLISNAIKFTNNSGRIDIYAEKDQTNVTVTVADNGVGIKTEVLSKLFDITYFQTTKGTAGETGTGFGLLLCKKFIELHGCVIWVESEPGKGSNFKFTLPISDHSNDPEISKKSEKSLNFSK